MHSDLCMQFLFILIFIFLSISLFVFEPRLVVLGSKSLYTKQTHIHTKIKCTWFLNIKVFVDSNFWINGKNAFSFVFKILGCYKLVDKTTLMRQWEKESRSLVLMRNNWAQQRSWVTHPRVASLHAHCNTPKKIQNKRKAFCHLFKNWS